MTQTSSYAQPRTAMVIQHPALGVTRIHYVPMTSVDMAREEFGPTLADAEAFVLTVCCTECGEDNEQAHLDGHECHSCGIAGCDCLVSQDAHNVDVFWCNDCRPICGGYCCA